MGYILTGILIGPSVLNYVNSHDTFATFSHLGIAILLFMVGLHLNPESIKNMGKSTLILGLLQILVTAGLSFGISYLIGFNITETIYLAVCLTFSSTIIIMKLISDKGDIDSLYGRITIGLLIIQDIVAMLALLLVATVNESNTWLLDFLEISVQSAGLIIIVLFVGKYFLPYIMKHIAKNQEFLMLFSLGWCLAIAEAFELFHLGIEIGALIAGITLSISPFKEEISSKMKILRDFFVLLFFVMIGTQISFSAIESMIIPLIILSVFVLVLKPIIIFVIMGLQGYRKRNSFLVGTSISQISEFSLIVAAAGLSAGHLTQNTLTLITGIAVITIAGSSYQIKHASVLFNFFSPILKIFEKKKTSFEHEHIHRTKKYNAIIFGSDRTGYDIIETFKKKKMNFLVVDFNPDVVNELREEGISCIYGDAEDSELLAELQIEKAKLFVVTIPVVETNLLLLKTILSRNKKAIVICTSSRIEDALMLYKQGASYVILPHLIGGHHTSMMIHEYGFDLKKFTTQKKKHIKHLTKRQNHKSK